MLVFCGFGWVIWILELKRKLSFKMRRHNSGLLSWSQLTNSKSILPPPKSFLADFLSCTRYTEYAFEFCLCVFIKSSKQHVIDSVIKGTYSRCATFKNYSVLQDVIKYSKNFELYLFTVAISFLLIANLIGMQEKVKTSFPWKVFCCINLQMI